MTTPSASSAYDAIKPSWRLPPRTRRAHWPACSPDPGPRHEFFVYVEDLDAALAAVRQTGATVLREPADMPWGERLAFVRDPEDNIVTLATPGR